MADILHDFPIAAPIERVFAAISEPAGIDAWWTKRCRGSPTVGAEYELYFGEPYDWRAVVTHCEAPKRFEIRMTRSAGDWADTRVGFELAPSDGTTLVRFHHLGWPDASAHYRTSTYCWAMYLRILKRHVEHGETVPYEVRLDV